MKKALPVSLIVPCYNRVKQTRSLLESLAAADFSCEIIVVDDASSEQLRVVCESFPGLHIRYHRLAENRGPAAARNTGIAMATFEFIAFTDNDCQVSADWLVRLHEYLSNTGSNVAGVGGRVLNLGQDLYSRYYTYHKILDPWYFEGRFTYLVTANAIFRKKHLQEAGGFDENIQQAGGEDPGLCFKLIARGYDLLYCPDAIVFHDYRPGLRVLYRVFYRYGYGCSLQWMRHFRRAEYKHEIGFGDTP